MKRWTIAGTAERTKTYRAEREKEGGAVGQRREGVSMQRWRDEKGEMDGEKERWVFIDCEGRVSHRTEAPSVVRPLLFFFESQSIVAVVSCVSGRRRWDRCLPASHPVSVCLQVCVCICIDLSVFFFHLLVPVATAETLSRRQPVPLAVKRPRKDVFWFPKDFSFLGTYT